MVLGEKHGTNYLPYTCLQKKEGVQENEQSKKSKV